jgi:hypothetical protein
LPATDPDKPTSTADFSSIAPGARVYDKEKGPSTSLIVINCPDETCEERDIPGTGRTVADFNDQYPPDADVCVVVFVSNLYGTISDWERLSSDELVDEITNSSLQTYSYPLPRLQVYRDEDSSLVQKSITTYRELICYQYARLIQLAAGIEDFAFLWTKYERLLNKEIEITSLTKENMYQLQEDFGVCTYCGTEAETQYDHIIPISDGGPSEITNQVPACKACNLEKSDQDVIDWHKDRDEPVPRIVWGKYLKLYRDRLEDAGELDMKFSEDERDRWDGVGITRNITRRIYSGRLKRDEAGRPPTETCSEEKVPEPDSDTPEQTTLGQWE